MKQILTICIAVIGMMTNAQKLNVSTSTVTTDAQIFTKQIKLNTVPLGKSTDKLLVRGSDRIVKEIPTDNIPIFLQGGGIPTSKDAFPYLGKQIFYYDNDNFNLYLFDYGMSDFTKVSKTSTLQEVTTSGNIINNGITMSNTNNSSYMKINSNTLMCNTIDGQSVLLESDNASLQLGSEKNKVTINGNSAELIINDGIGSKDGSNFLTLKSDKLFIKNGRSSTKEGNISFLTSTTPSTYNSEGIKGQIATDSNYLYVCYNTNQWARILITKNW